MDMPVMIKELLFSGKLRVELELAPTKPYVNNIRLAFMELPKIDFILRPLKSFDLMDLPGLSSWLTGTINDLLQEKLVDPNAITIPLARSYSSVRSVGVLKVSIFQIRGVKLVGNVAEPFVRLQVGGKIKAVSSRIDSDTMEWNQVFYVLVHTLKNPAIFVVVGSSYNVVGSVSYPLSEIEQDAGASADVWRTIVGHESSKIRGELNFGVEYFPAAEVPDPEADLNFESGIVQITIHQIKDLEEGGKPVSCCYELYVHPSSQRLSPTELPAPSSFGTNYYRSKNRKKTPNPTWDDVFEVFLEYKDTMSITLVARHATKEDVIFGHWSAPFGQLLNRTDWFQFTSPERAQFYASFIFRPIRVDLSRSRETQFSPCMGVIQIKVLSASGLKSGKGGHVAKVHLNGRLVGKTAVSLNECAPVWNRTFLTMVKEKHEKVTIEVCSGEKGHFHGRLKMAVAELLEHPGYEIEQHECMEGEEGEKLSAKLRFTMALFLIDRKSEEEADGESEPLLLPPDSTAGSNVGVLEVRSVTAEGLKPSTIRSLNYVKLAFDDGDPCYKTCPLRLPAEGGEQSWSSPAETIVSHVDEVEDLNLIVLEAQGIKEEEVGRLSVPLREMRAHRWYSLEGEAQAKLKLEARFHPIPVLMEPEVEETGTLQVELLDAHNLIAVDSGGTSDPFCVLRLNGQKFYKSQVVKECLNPTFQESASIEVRQKDVSVLQIELRDWNKVMASRTLGHVTIELQNLPADQWQELSKPLENVSSGTLHFSLKFVPSKSRRPSRRASNVIAVSHSRPTAVDPIPEAEPKEQFVPHKSRPQSPIADDGALRKSSALTLATAAAIRITIFEMQIEGSGGSSVRVEDCRIKVKREGQTIYKTRTIKQGPFRWNESFSLDPDAIDPQASFSIIPVWLHSPELSTTLTLADIDLSGGQEQRIELSLQTVGSISGRLVLLCGLSMDNTNLVDSHRRRRFSLFNRS